MLHRDRLFFKKSTTFLEQIISRLVVGVQFYYDLWITIFCCKQIVIFLEILTEIFLGNSSPP